MHAGNRCWQIMTSRSRWTVNQQTRWTRKIQRKAFLFGYCPSQLIYRTRRRSACTFFWKSNLRFGRWGFKSGDAKTEAQCSCLLPLNPEEIYSWNRKVWSFDNSRAQILQRRTWVSGQSPIRCRGTCSRHSVESVSNKNFTGDGEKFNKVPRAVAEGKSYSYVHFIRTWQVVLSWNHRTTTLHRSETIGIAERAVRRIKEETSTVSLQSGSDDKW